MSPTVRLLSSLLALALALAGCATTTTPSTPQSTGSSVAAASAVGAAAPTTPDVCAGVAGCRRVARVDVDGDGRRDQVGVVSTGIDSTDSTATGRITVRVRFATGATAQTTGRHVRWFAKPYFGAAELDGVRGAELFVGDTMGAHYEQFRVVSYRAGRLVTLKAPSLVSGEGFRPTSRWGVDGSYSSNAGVTRTVSGKGVVHVTLRTLQRNDSGRGHSGRVATYRWSTDRWVKVSAHSVHVSSDRKAFAVAGWHVRGLRHYA